ncbi:hypothetical protein ECTPHS_09008 [Ectothiorhodospira sp. PHS-1]|nr:hypothetical protein ECTPHS_09008 [Ectothiorhodospira sp. PHS-1]
MACRPETGGGWLMDVEMTRVISRALGSRDLNQVHFRWLEVCREADSMVG